MKGRLFRGAAAVLLLAGLAAAAPAASPGSAAKIGVVDLQRCLTESKVGKKYKAEFAAKADLAKADLDKQQAALDELRKTLEKQSLVLSEGARTSKDKEYRERLDSFREQVKATQQTLQKEDQELTRKILRDLQEIVKKIAESGAYEIILEKQEAGVVYMRSEEDVTDEVIRRYDQEVKGE